MTILISGRLKDAFDRPLANVNIKLGSLRTNLNTVVGTTTQFRTGNDGSYSVKVATGTYSVEVDFGGIGFSRVGEIQVLMDSLPGSLEKFLTIPGVSEITPEILAQVLQARKDAIEAAGNAASDATNIIMQQLKQQQSEFDSFLLSSGYAFLGDYGDGPFQFSARNQYVRYSNQYYRLNAATDVGFTTTGTTASSFANDINNFVLMDGDTLRQNFASSDGLKWIGRCPDLVALRNIEPTNSGQRISVVAHSPGWSVVAGVPSGGGEFYYDQNDTTSPDDGGHTIVTALGARWKRVDQDVIPEHFGFRAGSTDDQSAAIQAAIYFAVAKNRRLHGAPGKIAYITSQVYIPPYLIADWCGMTLKTITSGMSAIQLSTGAAPITTPYRPGTPLNNLIIEGRFKAGTNNVPDTTFATNGLIIGEQGSAQVSDLNISGLTIRGFQSSLVIAGPSAYLLKFSGCDIGVAWFRGISYTASSNSGENIQFFGGSIYNCVNAGASAQGVHVSPSASAVELVFNGVSFDYNDYDLSQSHSNVTINDCHQENNNNNPKIVIFNTPAKQPAKLRINGGSMGGGPHVSGLNSTVENAKGRPCYIDITGAGTSVILDKVQVGLYNADGNVTEVVRNSGKVAVRKLEVNILQDTGPSKGEGWPLNPSFSLNKLARFPNGSTDCWKLGAGSGNTLSASTAVSAAHDTGARLLTRPATSSATSISMYQDIRVSQGKTIILKSWLQTENVISQGGSAQLQTTFLTEDKAAAVVPTSIHPRKVAADGVLTECATVLPVPPSAAWLRVAIYGTNIATGVDSKIYSSGEQAWEL